VLAIVMTLVVAGFNPAPVVAGVDRPLTVWIVDAQDIVPAAACGAARAEAGRIWSRYGIELRWSSRLPANGLGLALVVLLSGTRDQHAPLGRVERVGETFRRQIIVSEPALIHLLNASGVDRSDPAWESLYARMFARVVSHELGHLLLNSAAHSQTGLMRPRFVASDVKNTADARFSLTAADRDGLRAAWSRDDLKVVPDD
jgi:hypothetical protein